MMMFLFTLFLIPLSIMNFWFTFQFGLLMLMFMIIFYPTMNYFSGISYFFGFDSLSYGLIILTILISSLMIISSNSIKSSYNSSFFMFTCLFLCFSLLVIFSALNIFIMYLFFELSLIPLMILIFSWGYQPERLISGLYLFFYTLFASLPLFLLLINLYNNYNTLLFDMDYGISKSFIIHFCLVFAFLVKLPMFMVHFWLPKAHVQSPISGSMILAGLLLKIGGYGMIRMMIIYMNTFIYFSYIWYSFALLGSILVSLICLMQGDVKCLIAYSSIAHMGLCIMGIVSMSKWGVLGSYLMMLSHGLCSSGLFCLANISYERFFSRSFFFNKGMLIFMPSMCIMWFMFSSFNMGCPPSLNFLSEILILNSMISYWGNSFIYFLLISFFSACFSFYLFSYTQHGMYNFCYCYSSGMVREYLLMMIHLVPLFLTLLVLNSLI